MARVGTRGLDLLQRVATASNTQTGVAALGLQAQHVRVYAGVPEYWGKPSKYTAGTDFLGTPTDHMELVAKRPVSPHVFEIDGKNMHYKMPMPAISSILARATGTALSVGAAGAAYVALTGDLPSAIAAFKASHPYLVYPTKAAIAYPLVYHYLAGVRHLVWDHGKIGNQVDKNSLLDLPAVESSSRIILGASVVATLGLAFYSS